MEQHAQMLTRGLNEYGGTYSRAPALRYFVDRSNPVSSCTDPFWRLIAYLIYNGVQLQPK